MLDLWKSYKAKHGTKASKTAFALTIAETYPVSFQTVRHNWLKGSHI
ncbi:TPA: hypothetical protein ACU207_001570 [Mannheimia haemolytica]|nr:hypothetical protein [Mannheimia haemolytica]MCB4227763.1 hypothetical protein [Mannheimia haemolytica]MEE3731849.1 hypothetical protein [Mannheimia haemolytica]